jgi:GTP-binding protein
MFSERIELRNIAIIAHVDHGKTTLVDGMLRQARVFRDNQAVAERVMDSNDLERERGITILAKNTAISIVDPLTGQPVKINIVDTPGHADFGGEVERVMNMVDGVLLLVDAAEGPMPQTRFVLKKALEMDHRAVVVINKVDRKGADPTQALNQTFDLFIQLGATDAQADFPVVYANAVTGQAGLTPELGPNLQPLFEAILRHVPAPRVNPEAPFQMLVTTLGYDDYRGATASGRITAGRLHAGMPLARITHDGRVLPAEARYLYQHQGLERVEVEQASAGDIVVIAGLEEVAIGETLADPETPVALPAIRVEEPTLRMTFAVNGSPFTGREGRWGTSRKLRERLFEELRTNVSLRVEETDSADRLNVSGRGELHLAILIETMRREGYEFQVSRPEVILRYEDGKTLEPFEEVYIETAPDVLGAVVEMLGSRRGQMIDMQDAGDAVRLRYLVRRGLVGFSLSLHDRHPRRRVPAQHLPRLPAAERRPAGARRRVAGGVGAGHHHELRPEERRGTRDVVHRPRGRGLCRDGRGGADTAGGHRRQRVQEAARHERALLQQRDRRTPDPAARDEPRSVHRVPARR